MAGDGTIRQDGGMEYRASGREKVIDVPLDTDVKPAEATSEAGQEGPSIRIGGNVREDVSPFGPPTDQATEARPYHSDDEMIRDVGDPRYGPDATYTAKVNARVSLTHFPRDRG